ncbi:hypothetical protein C5L14_05740 [Labrys okinawensis]|uniref:Uncharacterized protein n=1 Tax=Labrys okinawensis TaxID=346911 RepID=A0A2S9QHC1_9HYPH|nr:hypothetical protein [Labrys okinawensis]PRH88725.1 hypothetical protein C5L14_05740 [Labrys okinawensis]
MRRLIGSWAMLVPLMGLAVLTGPAAARDWSDYANARFGYRICYPADLMTAQPEADNGDGRVFSAPSGASLRVWGSYNAAEEDIDAIVAGVADDGKITYRSATKDWVVVSGRKGGETFYAKLLLEKDAKGTIETIRAFRLTYPAKEAAIYDAVAARLAKCFAVAR